MKFICACLSAALAVLNARAADTITNAAELVPCLGVNGRADVPFELTATVTRGTGSGAMASQTFYAKASGCDIRLVDKIRDSKPLLLSPGDVLHVTGVTVNLHDVVSADCETIEVIGHTPPEPPRQTTIRAILQGQHPYQYVRTHGRVTDAFNDDIDHQFVRVVIAPVDDPNIGSLNLTIPAATASLDVASSLIGAEVDACGVFSPVTRGLRRACRSEIDLRSFSDITVTRPAPSDPFDIPDLDDIRQSNAINVGRRRTAGRVIAVWRGRNVLIRTDAGEVIKAKLASANSPACGDDIVLAGLPDTDLFHVNLRRAIWKKTGESGSPADTPIPVTDDDLFTDGAGNPEIKADFHGKAVTLTGVVISLPTSNCDGERVHLKCGRHTIAVDTSSTPAARAGLEVGCTVTATGTCVVKTDHWKPNEPSPFIEEVFIVTRLPSDITVRARPPWWTTRRLTTLVSMLATVLLSILFWNFALRHVSERKSRELTAEKLANITSRLKVEERTRIAVELHDSIAQNLTGVSLEIDSAEQLAGKNPIGMMQHLQIAARTLQSCRNELRNCLWDLRSRALEEDDMNEAIRRAIAPQISDVTLTIRFNVPRAKLTDDVAHVLMRIVRELAINAVRHGKAKNVWIAGSLDGDRLLFSVRDDGSGFDPDTRPGVLQGHFGLQGIHERVNQFNGTMDIASAPGHGSKVTISLTIPTKEQT